MNCRAEIRQSDPAHFREWNSHRRPSRQSSQLLNDALHQVVMLSPSAFLDVAYLYSPILQFGGCSFFSWLHFPSDAVARYRIRANTYTIVIRILYHYSTVKSFTIPQFTAWANPPSVIVAIEDLCISTYFLCKAYAWRTKQFFDAAGLSAARQRCSNGYSIGRHP